MAADGRASFVGRERELAELCAGLGEVRAGRGRLFLIVGEAGIGKTSLAGQLHAAAEAAGARVRWARCWEGGGAPAFWPWTVLLRALARDCDDQTLAAALSGSGAPAAQLVPELRERLPDLPATPAGSALDTAHARFPLFDAVATVLKRLAAARPLVLVLDDLHAADHASLLLLNFLARDLHEAPLLVIGTYREPEAHLDAERARLLTAVGRAGVRLPLQGWAEAEVGRFVAGLCGGAPAAALVGELYRVTEGNPFFVDEIVRLLLADGGGRLPSAPALRVPGNVRATIRERLRPLAADALRVLGAAAVCGRDFDVALLREACGVDGEWLLDALAGAERVGVVARRSGALPRYRFAHALIREALYDDLGAAERVAWHRRIGEALERLHGGHLEPHLEELAHHFAHAAALEGLGAAPDGAVDKAVAYASRAAERAAALLAYEEAAQHYERALRARALRGAADPRAELPLRLALGEMQAAAWNLEAARQTFRAAIEQARRLDLPDAWARAALGFAGLGFGLPRGVVDAEIVTLLEDALRARAAARDPLWARLAVRLAVELHFSADAERRDTLSRAALAVARGAGDPATLAYVLNARHFAVWDSAEVEERLALADEAVRLADAGGDTDMALQGRIWRLLDLAEVGDASAFDREFEIFARQAEERRLPKYLGFAIAMRGLRAMWLGEFERVVDNAQRGVALGERVGDPVAFASVGVQIFVARRAQGRLAEMEPLVRQWVELLPASPVPRCLLALTYVELDRRDDARREYECLVADDLVALQRRNVLHPLLPYLSEVCAALGDRRRAPIFYRCLLPFAGRNMGLGPNALFGPASHALGILARLLGQWDDAVRHFEAALEETQRMHGPAWQAATQLEYARALQAHGTAAAAERAATLAAAAAELAQRLGMPRLHAGARALRASLATDPDPEAARASAAVAAAHTGAGRASVGSPAPGREAPPSGRVLPFPLKGGGRGAPARALGLHDGLFRCEGEYWSVGTGAGVVRLRNTSGLRYLAHLLAHPGREFHALDLAALEQAPSDARALDAAQAVEAGLTLGESPDAHALLDDRARADYRRRLDDLRDQLEEARGFNDLARAGKLEHDIAFLTQELARAVGLGGRNRPGSSRAERARLNVTRAIKSAIRRIAAGNRDVGLYFETTIKTGAFCSYTPDPRFPVTWTC